MLWKGCRVQICFNLTFYDSISDIKRVALKIGTHGEMHRTD